MNESITTKSKQPKSSLSEISVIAIIVVAAFVIALVIRAFFLQLFYIPSASMEPYLKVNDKVFVNKIAYTFHDVQRGDVVVFNAPDSIKSDRVQDLVKRVVGLPGETVEGRCKNKKETSCVVDIYVDGKKLNEPYLKDGIVYKPFDPVVVPDNALFMMGDNRDDSEDSRYFGTIPIDSIIGRAFFRVWPLSRFGYLQ